MSTDAMLGTNHQWSAPDAKGVRWCIKDGCTIRVGDTYRWWQRKKGGHWRRQDRELIPDCKGTWP